MSVKIGHAALDEKGAIKGGAAGDQTGKEVCIRNWYADTWTVLLRPKTTVLAEKMAAACEAACTNNVIGYDQNQRNTLRTQAKAANWELGKITTPCECDCSSLMTVCAEAAGVNMDSAYTSGNAPTTTTMQAKFTATGQFTAYTDKKYLTTSDYVQRGDVLVKRGSHTVMVLSDGAKADAVNDSISGTASSAISSIGKIGSNTDSALNVRKTPNGAIVDVFSHGVCVRIVASEGNWYKINHLGSNAYVYASYFSLDNENEVTYMAYCNDPALNVRSAPNGTRLGTFKYNDMIGVISEAGNWCKIKYGNTYAYVYKDYITKESAEILFWGTVKTPDDLNIREKASSNSDSKILGKFYNNDRIRVYGVNGSWYKIRYEDQDAWVHASYIVKS